MLQGGSKDRSSRAQRTAEAQKQTVQWLVETYELVQGGSYPKAEVYKEYLDFCHQNGLTPTTAPAFGKVIRMAFPNLQCRRKGPRGEAKHHYRNFGRKQDRETVVLARSVTINSPLSLPLLQATKETTQRYNDDTKAVGIVPSPFRISGRPSMGPLFTRSSSPSPDREYTLPPLAAEIQVARQPSPVRETVAWPKRSDQGGGDDEAPRVLGRKRPWEPSPPESGGVASSSSSSSLPSKKRLSMSGTSSDMMSDTSAASSISSLPPEPSLRRSSICALLNDTPAEPMEMIFENKPQQQQQQQKQHSPPQHSPQQQQHSQQQQQTQPSKLPSLPALQPLPPLPYLPLPPPPSSLGLAITPPLPSLEPTTVAPIIPAVVGGVASINGPPDIPDTLALPPIGGTENRPPWWFIEKKLEDIRRYVLQYIPGMKGVRESSGGVGGVGEVSVGVEWLNEEEYLRFFEAAASNPNADRETLIKSLYQYRALVSEREREINVLNARLREWHERERTELEWEMQLDREWEIQKRLMEMKRNIIEGGGGAGEKVEEREKEREIVEERKESPPFQHYSYREKRSRREYQAMKEEEEEEDDDEENSDDDEEENMKRGHRWIGWGQQTVDNDRLMTSAKEREREMRYQLPQEAIQRIDSAPGTFEQLRKAHLHSLGQQQPHHTQHPQQPHHHSSGVRLQEPPAVVSEVLMTENPEPKDKAKASWREIVGAPSEDSPFLSRRGSLRIEESGVVGASVAGGVLPGSDSAPPLVVAGSRSASPAPSLAPRSANRNKSQAGQSAGSKKDAVPLVLRWIRSTYERLEANDLPSDVPKEEVYENYKFFCMRYGIQPTNSATFGKLLRSVFPDLKTRRLGSRGNTKHHYNGIRMIRDPRLPIDTSDSPPHSAPPSPLNTSISPPVSIGRQQPQQSSPPSSPSSILFSLSQQQSVTPDRPVVPILPPLTQQAQHVQPSLSLSTLAAASANQAVSGGGGGGGGVPKVVIPIPRRFLSSSPTTTSTTYPSSGNSSEHSSASTSPQPSSPPSPSSSSPSSPSSSPRSSPPPASPLPPPSTSSSSSSSVQHNQSPTETHQHYQSQQPQQPQQQREKKEPFPVWNFYVASGNEPTTTTTRAK